MESYVFSLVRINMVLPGLGESHLRDASARDTGTMPSLLTTLGLWKDTRKSGPEICLGQQ